MCTHSNKHTHAHACTKRSKQMLICVQRQTEKNKDMAHARSTSLIAFCRAYEDNPHGHKQCTAVYLLQTWTHTHMTLALSPFLFAVSLVSTVPHVLSSQAGSTGSLSCYPCIICGCRQFAILHWLKLAIRKPLQSSYGSHVSAGQIRHAPSPMTQTNLCTYCGSLTLFFSAVYCLTLLKLVWDTQGFGFGIEKYLDTFDIRVNDIYINLLKKGFYI